jgi:hypothetical protein
MSENLISTRECTLSSINIPSIDKALSAMSSEILKASFLLSKIQETSISLEKVIHNSHFVDSSAHNKATALKESAYNFEFAISEIKY